MSTGTKNLPAQKLRLLVELPCDGVPRFQVQGSVMAFKLPYSSAYAEIFRLSGGTTQPGMAADSKPRRIFTPWGIKRLMALNALYRPYAERHHAAMVAAAKLAPPPVPATVAP